MSTIERKATNTITTSLCHLKLRNQNARDEIRALRRSIVGARPSVANARQDVGGDPELTAATIARRVDTRRETEDAALVKLTELRAIADDTRAVLDGGLGVALTDAKRAEAERQEPTRVRSRPRAGPAQW